MQTSVSLEKGGEEKNILSCGFFLIRYTLNGTSLQVGIIIWHCVIRSFLKINHHH